MPRRAKVIKRIIAPDAKYQSEDLAKFINRIMYSGKKSTAERVVYKSLDMLEEQAHRSPLEIFEQALRNVTPVVEVKPRRVGGATYQVPVDIRTERRGALAMRWLIGAARSRKGKSMAEKLAAELSDAAAGQGGSVKKREDTHRMAEANRAFVHYRW